MYPRHLLWVYLWLALGSWVRAHDPGLSTATLKLEDDQLNAILTFAPADLESFLPLEEIAWDGLEVHLDGRLVSATQPWVQRDDRDNIHIRLSFPLQGITHLRVRSTFIADLPRGHRQYLSLQDDHGDVLQEFLLDANSDVFETTLTGPARSEPGPRGFKPFFVLGLEHIATGYDHLLFLFGLLIVGSSFLSVGKIITSFTVAHSITLALATFHLVHLPPHVVEPFIAISIMYVGIENIFRHNLERRWLLTFVFGLVHGLGFASVLRELGVGLDGSTIGVPLVSFNLGVEAGQVAIAAVALPLIWRFKQHPSFVARFTDFSSWMVTLAGTYWLLERTLL